MSHTYRILQYGVNTGAGVYTPPPEFNCTALVATCRTHTVFYSTVLTRVPEYTTPPPNTIPGDSGLNYNKRYPPRLPNPTPEW